VSAQLPISLLSEPPDLGQQALCGRCIGNDHDQCLVVCLQLMRRLREHPGFCGTMQWWQYETRTGLR
jgi:hypothetical protein